ncbi:MAG: HlyD family secretion protein [Alphaproteobacteria bacterium]
MGFWRGLAVLLIVVAVGGGGFLLWERWRNDGETPGIVSGNGRIEGKEIDVATKFPGRVDIVFVKEGDDVVKGQPLVQFDARALRASLAQVKAQLNRAAYHVTSASAEIIRRRSDLELAEIELKRSETLYERGFATRERLDRDRSRREVNQSILDAARSSLEAAKTEIAELRARVEEIEADLSDMVLYAPTGGRVLYRMAEPGEVLASGGKALVMIDLDDLYMTIYLPERAAGRVRVKDEALIRLDAIPNAPVAAYVSFLSAEAEFTPKEVETTEERQKLVFRVKLQVRDNRDRMVKPGMPGDGFVRVEPDAPWPAKKP